MHLKTLCRLLVLTFVATCFSSCSTTEQTPAQKDAASERRVKHATEHIRKVNRGRPKH